MAAKAFAVSTNCEYFEQTVQMRETMFREQIERSRMKLCMTHVMHSFVFRPKGLTRISFFAMFIGAYTASHGLGREILSS